MVTRRIKQEETTEDFLGLIAFGSLIGNIFQIASKNALENQHGKLKAYADNLKKHYDNMIERYKQGRNLCLKDDEHVIMHLDLVTGADDENR